MTDRYVIKPLDQSTWDDFLAVCANSNGFPSGCHCIGFHPEGVEKGRPDINRDRKRERVFAGTAHAALVFDGDECVGWAQFGSPEELPRIKSRRAYDQTATSVPDWRIACTYVAAGHRRQGVATAALTGALDLIASLGGGVVEGYPEPADAVPAGFLFNGALSTYESLGFERDRMIGKHRWVVRTTVDPA